MIHPDVFCRSNVLSIYYTICKEVLQDAVEVASALLFHQALEGILQEGHIDIVVARQPGALATTQRHGKRRQQHSPSCKVQSCRGSRARQQQGRMQVQYILVYVGCKLNASWCTNANYIQVYLCILMYGYHLHPSVLLQYDIMTIGNSFNPTG